MLKRFLQTSCGVLIIYMILTTCAFSADTTVPIYLNDIEQPTSALSRDGKTLAPLRDICNMLLCEITYNNQSKEIVIYQGNEAWHLQISSKAVVYCVGSEAANSLTLSQMPICKNGHIYLPIADIAELLSCDVYWDSAKRVVKVVTPIVYKNKQWLTQDGRAISERDTYNKTDGVEYVILSAGSLDTPLASKMVIFALKADGTGRRIASANSIIGSPVIADNCCYFLSYNPITCSGHIIKSSLADTTQTIMLGYTGWTYGYALENYINLEGKEEIISQPAKPPFVVKEDGVYVNGWDTNGFSEGNMRDIKIFSSTYGIYKLPKNGGEQELVSLYNLDWLK